VIFLGSMKCPIFLLLPLHNSNLLLTSPLLFAAARRARPPVPI
jgi:hypothetical protein